MWRATAVSILLALVACGDDTSSDASSTGETTLSSYRQAARERALALCDHIGECCAAQGWTHEPDACRAFVAGNLGANESMFDASGASIDEAALATCIEATVAIAAVCVPDVATYRAWEIACSRVISGPKPAGATCTTDFECALPLSGEALCQRQDGGAAAICVQRIPAEPGGPCAKDAPIQHDCSDHPRTGEHPQLYCSAAGACTARWAEGDGPCSTSQCEPGLYCDGTCVPHEGEGEGCLLADACGPGGACVDGTCSAPLSTGEACTSLAQCASGRCEQVCLPGTLVVDRRICGG